MAYDFSGKRALVTGASTGIGRAIALRLSQLGADVVALCIQKKNLESLKAEDPKITTVYCDLRDWKETRRIVKTLTPIHLLVNNAGVALKEEFLDITLDKFDETFNVNLKAVINVSQVIASDLIDKSEKGIIVNMSSVSVFRPFPRKAVYGASKAAVNNLTKSMAIELSPKRIRANAVCPGLVTTGMGLSSLKSVPHLNAKTVNPLQKFVETDDVVNTVVFLLSEKSAMVNGTVLPVEGGFLAK